MHECLGRPVRCFEGLPCILLGAGVCKGTNTKREEKQTHDLRIKYSRGTLSQTDVLLLQSWAVVAACQHPADNAYMDTSLSTAPDVKEQLQMDTVD